MKIYGVNYQMMNEGEVIPPPAIWGNLISHFRLGEQSFFFQIK